MIKTTVITIVLLTTINADLAKEHMPISAKAGQCFTKSFFPPKYKKTIRIKSTKKVLISKSTIKHKVIPAKYEWITQKVKISDGTEKIVTTPAVYKRVYEKILVEPSEKIWKKSLNLNAPKAFHSCVESASLSGMNVKDAKVGSCFYEHYKPAKYVTTTEKILASEASTRVVTTPAKYRTYTKKIKIDATTAKLIPVAAKYKNVKKKVVVAPAKSEWKKTACQNRGCNQSEVVCLVEIPKQFKTVTKRILLKAAVAKKVAISPLYKTVEIEEMIKPATSRVIPIPAKYQNISRKKRVSDEKFYWSNSSNDGINSRLKTQCDKICLTQTNPKYKTISKRVVVTPASSKKIKTPPRYKMVKVKKILKPASFKEIVVPAEYKTVTVERERTKGFSKWMPIVCESNMTPTTIRKVQEALKKAGYYKGPIDGVWSLESKLATRAYQKAKGLAVTRLSIETMTSLGIY